MNKRRMLSKSLLHSYSFLSLRVSTQRLYTFLLVETDDDGFVGNFSGYIKSIDGTMDEIMELRDAGFIITFTTNTLVVSHFHKMNTIQNDRYRPTEFVNEYKLLGIDEQKCYFIK